MKRHLPRNAGRRRQVLPRADVVETEPTASTPSIVRRAGQLATLLVACGLVASIRSASVSARSAGR
jgi:hypothetical protein